MKPEHRDPPPWAVGEPDAAEADPWRGDVAAGVEAWTRGRAAQEVEPRRRRPLVEPQGRRPLVEQRGRPRPSVVETTGAEPDGGPSPQRSRSRRGRRTPPPPPDTATQSPPADPESVARTILLDQLTGRARSRQELSDKLRAREVPDEIASGLLDRFEEVGLVDDGAFARTWVDQRGRTRGRRALQQELRRKGVDDEVVREALHDLEPDDEEAAARALVQKKLRTLSRVDDVAATRRLVGMLARKGYSGSLVWRVVREELADAGRETPDTDL